MEKIKETIMRTRNEDEDENEDEYLRGPRMSRGRPGQAPLYRALRTSHSSRGQSGRGGSHPADRHR